MIPHSYGTEWKTDAAGHWHVCDLWREKDEVAHSYKWVIDQEATDTQNGSKHQECSVCGYALNPVEIPQAEKPQTDPPQTEAPQTGDTHHPLLWLALCGVAAVGLGATFFVKKKQVN